MGDVNERGRDNKLEQSVHTLRVRDPSLTGIARKLKEVGRALDSITTRWDLARFLNKTENAQKLNGLVEDIRDALMAYQVCTSKPHVHITSNNAPELIAARYIQQELPNDCKSYPITT